jgi:hypothetical protein
MGWGARTHEGQYHTRSTRQSETSVRTVRLHTNFKPGQRGFIGGRAYEVSQAGSLRRLAAAAVVGMLRTIAGQ